MIIDAHYSSLSSCLVPPKTSVPSRSYTLSSGAKFEIECTIEAYPKANSFWFRKPERRQKLTQKSFSILSTTTTTTTIKSNDRLAASGAVLSRATSPTSSSLVEEGFFETTNLEQPNSNVELIYPVWENTTAKVFQPLKEPDIETLPNPKSLLVAVRQTAVNPFTYKLKLTFVKISAEDYGEYTCYSMNAVGNSSSSFTIVSKCQSTLLLAVLFHLELQIKKFAIFLIIPQGLQAN